MDKDIILIFSVRTVLIISAFLILTKLFTCLSWDWGKVTSPLWIGIPLIGLVSGFIDVLKFYKK